MFPWDQPQQPTRARDAPIGLENVNASNMGVSSQRSEYAAALKAQVDQRAHAKANYKVAQLEADRADDLRVERESAKFRADAEGEIQAQRDREALVARREAMAMARFQSQQPSREQKVEAYQQQLEASSAPPMVAGGRMPVRNEHTGISEHPSTRVHAAPGGQSSFSFSDGSAPQQRAASQPPARQQMMNLPPQQADAEQYASEQRAAASSIRDRARGGRSLW